eukprot:3898802-Prymnesium_polylepis.1
MAPPVSAFELRILHSMRVRCAAVTLIAPLKWPSKTVCSSATRPPIIESARSEDDMVEASTLHGIASMLQFVTVRWASSTFSVPRSRKLEMCMGGAPSKMVNRRGSAGSTARTVAPALLVIHTCSKENG